MTTYVLIYLVLRDLPALYSKYRQLTKKRKQLPRKRK